MELSAAEAAQNEVPTILAVAWILIVVPGAFVALRIYCKIFLAKGFGWDDGICVFSWLLQLIYTALITRATQMGVLGRHVEAIQDQGMVSHGLKLVYIGFVIMIFGCVFAKSSFVITLLRIVTRTWQKAILWFIMISMNAVMWLCGICYLAQCTPTAALWDTETRATAKCWPTDVYENIGITAGAYSGCMEFILALFPWVILWEIQMEKREKIGIMIAMSLGIFASIAAFIKTSKLVNVSNISDFTYYCTPILLWASTETGLTIFASSIPTLRILLVRMRSTNEAKYSSETCYRTHFSHNKMRSDPYYHMNSDTITLTDRNDNDSDKSTLGDLGMLESVLHAGNLSTRRFSWIPVESTHDFIMESLA
ncbi:hypothetical protein N7466_010118 [Penicillium verhagenii]|uniref:uncharacterized protein n=1 Tax=Penicillium verhagenii TaxID=1562060 RepID=UPI0025450504|nr:uncharacterized protein N7466_010118 [Penicillium verhagenii]KAJ5919175.1 hypothetical protein N7466_010118 [Penicillium verhagenii]